MTFIKGQKAWNKGIDHLSVDAKKRIGEAMKKRLKEQGHPRGMLGKQHTEKIRKQISKSLLNGEKRKNKYPRGYKYGHVKVRLVRGNPILCEFCGTTKPDKKYDWANVSQDYRNPFDYKSACRPCHKKFDSLCVNLTVNNETLNMTEWRKKLGVSGHSLRYRLKHWTLEEALTTPKKGTIITI